MNFPNGLRFIHTRHASPVCKLGALSHLEFVLSRNPSIHPSIYHLYIYVCLPDPAFPKPPLLCLPFRPASSSSSSSLFVGRSLKNFTHLLTNSLFNNLCNLVNPFHQLLPPSLLSTSFKPMTSNRQHHPRQVLSLPLNLLQVPNCPIFPKSLKLLILRLNYPMQSPNLWMNFSGFLRNLNSRKSLLFWRNRRHRNHPCCLLQSSKSSHHMNRLKLPRKSVWIRSHPLNLWNQQYRR